jgi:hypothetical protein
MKKLMIAAAIVCAAALSHGASVYWGGAIATPDCSDTLPAGTQAALLYSATAFTGAASTLDGWTVGSAADNGGSLVQIYSLTGGDSANWAFTGTYSVDGSVDGYYAVLVLNDAGDHASYYDIGNVSGTTGASAPTEKRVNVDWSGSEYLTSGGYTVAVPEPTSGLLLLLGMAGLALKRKRA